VPDPLRDLIQSMLGDMAEIATGMDNGDYTADEMQALLMESAMEHHAAAMFAGLGVDELSGAERADLIDRLQAQREYADGFADEVAAVGWAAIAGGAARLALYAGALKATYWKAKTWDLDLPAYPTEGSECMVNCKCYWEIDMVDIEAGDFDCYWRMGGTERHCVTCPQRASDWSPYRIRGGVAA
jgi:hypothetical protein